MIKKSDLVFTVCTSPDDGVTNKIVIACDGVVGTDAKIKEIMYNQNVTKDLGNFIKSIEDVDDDTIRTQDEILHTLKFIKNQKGATE